MNGENSFSLEYRKIFTPSLLKMSCSTETTFTNSFNLSFNNSKIMKTPDHNTTNRTIYSTSSLKIYALQREIA